MIGYLRGNVVKVDAGFCILSCGGVGYKVAATRATLLPLQEGAEVALWTHLAVRESVLDLYGFTDPDEQHLFEMLLTVSGIGPKSALAILDIASVETLRSAISTGRSEYLTKVSGIGKKTAEKIVLELRDKVGAGATREGAALKGDEEALEAMKSLGYSTQEARDALRKVPTDIESSSERLREALKIMGR